VALLAARQETARKDSQIAVFTGAAGGVGVTTLAIEAAMQVLQRAGPGETTCLVDLDLSGDACADYLDLEPRLEFAEIGPRGERLDLQLLEALCARHKSGLAVIASPARPGEVFDVEPETIGRLLDVVAMRFDHVVIDLPRQWRPWTDAVIGGADSLYVVTDMTAPGLRVARRLVERIVERTKGRVGPKVIVNRFTRAASFANGLRGADVERALGSTYAGPVVSNYGLTREAIDRGMTLGELKPGNNISADLARILDPAAPADANFSTRLVQFLSRF
jgi:pilus assembly protein CpaE